jgi:hypothetical protein
MINGNYEAEITRVTQIQTVDQMVFTDFTGRITQAGTRTGGRDQGNIIDHQEHVLRENAHFYFVKFLTFELAERTLSASQIEEISTLTPEELVAKFEIYITEQDVKEVITKLIGDEED